MNDVSPFGSFRPTGFKARLIDRIGLFPDSWGGRRCAYFLRYLALLALKGKPVDVERLGVRMRLYPYHNVCEKRILFTPQYFDPREREILAEFIAGTSGEFHFIDIGSNVGAYALFAAHSAGVRARVLAVEPQPEIFNRLVYNIQQNQEGSIKAVSCAVADRSGELTLFLNAENSGQASVIVVDTELLSSIRVPSVTLLELLGQEAITRVDAMKLDVEGAEDLILVPFLRDAPRSLYPALIIMENGQWQVNLENLLTEKGYRLFERTRMNMIIRLEPPAETSVSA
ncbi:MAG: FkbM family methyltransferase [Methylobacteriaceae bacterium]|nr:FkbM family methyltransferase [Methylobacteriaceae bacterium]